MTGSRAAFPQLSSRWGTVISTALVLVLLFLASFAVWAAGTTKQAAANAGHATILSEDYQQARYWIGAEESLERKYRLEPGPAMLAAHHAAGRAVQTALNTIQRDGAAADRALVAAVLVKHRAYLDATWHGMFPAVDAHNTARVLYSDHSVVDPIFSFIEGHMGAAAAAEHRAALATIRTLEDTQQVVMTTTPLVFLLGISLLAALWTVLRRYQRRREALFRALVQNASDLIAIADPAGRLSYVSPSVTAVLGYPGAALVGTNWRDLIHPDDLDLVRRGDAEIATPPATPLVGEVRLRHEDGSWRTLEARRTNLLDEPGVGGIVINARDVTQRAVFEEQLRHQAFHDSLTGLPNRALFLDRLERALARAARHSTTVAVLSLDLDRFKVINDSLGHAAGDQLLVAVAARLVGCLRQEDTAARMGGDEFAILLGEPVTVRQATAAAERIIAVLEAPFPLEGHEVVTATSIGILISEPGHTPADVGRNVDVALYRAKSSGRGRYALFDETMNAHALERLELETDLRRALERGEFAVYYQPKMALDSGALVGMEALVRWLSPTRGLVAPGDFIALAEETGLIRPLGQWVLEETCRQAHHWHAQAPQTPLVLSVNLSARQFQHPALVEDVARALQDSGVPPHLIQLEITESVVMEDAQTTIATLHRLKALGVELAIDDFGTGYSSLSYLKRFPVDTLKIDRSFVSGLRQDSDDASIIQAVVSLGHALRLGVVAEGVETAEEAVQLHDLGCELGQGYHFAKPLPHAQAEAFVLQARERTAQACAG